MTTPAVLDADGQPSAGGHRSTRWSRRCRAMHDLARPAADRNSPAGSVYVVKPKMHGPDEVALTDDMFARRRGGARAAARTRSRSASWTRSGAPRVNLAECIRAAASRVVFINTGFLDRTGDEIHTSMLAGADGAQGRHARRSGGSWPTRTGTSTPAWRAGCAGGPRSARACGPRPTSWPTCSTRRSATPRPAPAARGCRRRPRRRCTPRTTTGSTSRERQRELSGGAAAGVARRPAGDPARGPRPSGPTTSAEPRSTTTCRASSATSCAGSTRASAARRCPTSTASR